MRALLVGAMAAMLVGCSCFVSPQSGIEACTGADGRGFACFDRNVPAARLSQAEPEPSPDPTTPREKTAHASRRVKPSSAHAAKTTTDHAASNSAPAAEAKVEPAAAGQPPAIDPVVDRARIAVAAKLEDPASAVFGDMNRSMRKNLLGKSVDTICGQVKSKKASGDGIGDRPFLYLVKEDEAYVADGSPTSVASTAYHNICN